MQLGESVKNCITLDHSFKKALEFERSSGFFLCDKYLLNNDQFGMTNQLELLQIFVHLSDVRSNFSPWALIIWLLRELKSAG